MPPLGLNRGGGRGSGRATAAFMAVIAASFLLLGARGGAVATAAAATAAPPTGATDVSGASAAAAAAAAADPVADDANLDVDGADEDDGPGGVNFDNAFGPPGDAWPEDARAIFQAMRSPAGEEIVLEKNVFVERILPASVLRQLTEEEMAQYRAPYLAPGEDRRPTLDWPRQIPVAGDPPETAAIVTRYAEWLAESDLPKLFINAEPGSILIGAARTICRRWPNQTEVTVTGSHFIQEDSPDEIAAALRAFVAGLQGAFP